jgi:hypothetical protein
MRVMEIRNPKSETRNNLGAQNSKWLVLRRVVSTLLLALSLSALAGCATTDEEASYSSERPWNTPRSWETGLPSSLNEGR